MRAGNYSRWNLAKGARYGVTTCSLSSFDTQITVLNDGSGAFVAYNDDFCGLQTYTTFTAPSTGFFRVLLDQFNCSNSGALGSYRIGRIGGPVNDLCSGATPISIGGSIASNNTCCATNTYSATCGTSNGTNGDVWYRVTGNGNRLRAEMISGNYDTKLQVFSGTCGSLVCIGGNDDGGSGLLSLLDWCTTNGTTYYIRQFGFSSNCGEATLRITDLGNAAPVNTFCPSNITVSGTAGANPCTAPVTYTTPTFTDDCFTPSVGLSAGLASGSNFPQGTTTVTYTAGDNVGNTTNCTFTVTVTPCNRAPAAVCQNITRNANASCQANASASAFDGGSTDPDGDPLTFSVSPTGPYPLGTTTVTLTVSDGLLTDNCTATITVVDNTNPSISCPSNISTGTNSTICGAVVTYSAPVGTDNCPGASTALTGGLASGATFSVGTTTNTYTVTDGAGNTASCSFTVTVTDDDNPVVNCPSNISVNNDAGNCSAVVSYSVTTSDNCPGETLSQTGGQASGTAFPVGTTTNAFTVTDAAGNTASCSFTVTVTDNENPTITCPSNITANNDAGNCSAVVTYSVSSADNCPGQTVSQTGGQASGTAFPVGTTTNSFTVTDAAGNTASCSFTVTVNDNENPTITCPSNITTNNDAGNCSAVVTYSVSSTDNCPGQTVAQTGGQASGTAFPVGTTTNSFTVTDAAGNTASCSFTVTVNDNENPTISCPANITVNTAPGVCTQVVSFTVSSSDNCPGQTVAQTGGLASGATFPLNTTTNSFTVTDAAGNTASCSFTVTVNDNENPTISCPANISVANDPGNCSAIVSYVVNFADNCSANLTQTAGLSSGTAFPVGTTTNTFTVTDTAGNTASCSFTVAVADTQHPVITCPADTVISNDTTVCQAVFSYSTPVGTDNCPGSVTTLTAGLASGATFPLGTTTQVYVVVDASSNADTCSFNVTVEDDEIPAIANCPANITIPNISGTCNGIAVWTPPTVTDNCNLATFGTTTPPGSSFPGGVNTVTYTATDSAGNLAICSFTVTVQDTQAPTINNCPSNISVNTDPGVCGALVSWTTPTANDNCVLNSFTTTHPSGTTFPVTTTTVTYTAADNAGNQSFCVFTVTVTDNEDPVLTGCPGNIVRNTDPGVCTATVSWASPSASDNCTVTSLTGTHVSGTSFGPGVTTVTYVAVDNSGNSDTCSFNITVSDNENPTITGCPSNISAGTDAGVCSAVVTWAAPTITDNCQLGTVTASHTSGSTFPLGSTSVVITASDTAGNTSTCAFTVNVADNENPVLTGCPTNITVNADTSGCAATVNWTPPTASDNCSIASLTSTHTPGTSFPVGTTSVSYTATDSSGNSATCSFNVNVVDNTDPIITGCPANISVNNDAGQCSAVVSWTPPSASDNCAIATFTSTHTPGTTFPVGSTTVVYTATDSSGNSVTCSFTVTVTDNEDPVISGCPSNITANNTSGACSATVSWTPPTSSDNCSVTNFTSTHTPGGTFPVGTTTVTYVALDAAGNSDTCSFTVTVVDNQNPTITGCPGNVTTGNDAGNCSAAVNWTAPTASDNCSVSSFTSTHASGATFPLGATTVTYTAVDASGNTATCSFTVTVNDTEAPTITCPGNISTSVDSGLCSAVVSYTAPIGADNCPGASTTQTAGLGSGSAFPVGATTETYTVTDTAGNSTSCSFTITVVDDENPVVVCPANITVNNDAGNCSAVVTYTVTTSDNCPGETLALTSGQASGSAFPVGTTTNIFTVTDAGGNTASCSFTVTVNDNENPVIASCPANITQNADPGVCSALVSWLPPTASDNCTVSSLVGTHSPGASFPVGSTTVTYVATDNSGNTDTCSFTITVVDNQPPQLINCPGNITQPALAGRCDAIVNWAPPTATDNCVGVTVTSNFSPGGFFNVGTVTVTYVATDAGGNTDSCSFNVTVVDLEFPVITGCPANITVPNDTGLCGAVVGWTPPTSSDNCGIQSFTSNFIPGDTFVIGTSTVTYTAVDSSGNTTTCNFNVTVNDVEFPVIVCPTSFTVSNDTGFCSAVVTYTTPVGTDNCPASVTTQTTGLASGATFPLGTTTNTFSVTDASGNTSTCNFDITVEDNEAPVISCLPNITANNDVGFCSAVVSYTIVSADNCPGDTLIQIAGLTSGSAFPVGTTTNTFVAIDAAGNTDTCSWDVTIVDNEAPVITCPANVTVNNDSALCSAVVTYTVGTSDNCPGDTLVQVAGLPSGSAFPVGLTINTFILTDASGNTDSCSFTITVLDTELPVITCPGSISVNNDSSLCSAVVTYSTPTATDNCPGVSFFQIAGQPSGSAFPLGTTQNTYLVIDASGNSDSCSFDVIVIDNEAPVIVCPNDTTVGNDTAACGAVVNYPAPVNTDNCPGQTVAQITGLASGSFFTVGTTLNTFVVTDGSGNSDTCSFNVTVLDNTAPVISCPATITVNNDSSQCSAVVTYSATTSDNCPGEFVTTIAGLASGSAFPVGTTTNVLVVSDSAGNTDTCSFDVIVIDSENPVVTCPANITVNNDSAVCGANVTYTVNTSDNCPGDTLVLTSGLASGSFFPVGTTTNGYLLTDASGNTDSCSFSVTVVDAEAPEITCPAPITVNADTGLCSALVSFAAPTVVENCAGDTVIQIGGLASGSAFPVGQTVNTFVAIDAAGNADTCSFTIDVIDNQPPVIVCPANITTSVDTGQCSAVVTYTAPTGTDNCTGDTTIQIAGLASGATFPLGTTTNTFVTIDGGGNTDTCSFDVTVVDDEDPVMTCPANITVNNSPGQCSAAITYTTSVSDNCPGATSSQIAGLPSSFTFQVGTTTNTFVATDAAGNTDTCSFDVTIVDAEAPVIVCPGNISVPNDTGVCGAVVTYVTPIGTDNCPNDTTFQIAGLASGSTFPVGITTNTFVVVDNGGLSDTCSFTVTVQDLEPPVPNCPANITVGTDPGVCSAVVSYPAPTVTDNCPGALIFQTGGQASGSSFSLGTTTQTYTAIDAASNLVTCSFTVTVNDSQPPIIIGCPSNLTQTNDLGQCTAQVTWPVPSASDNCTLASFTSSHAPGFAFNVGTTTVIYTAGDAVGNTTSCSFTVTVTDAQDPVITGCPTNRNVGTNPAFCGAIVTWTPPTATDNCLVSSFNSTFVPGDTFAVGTSTVTYVAIDPSGNTDTCSFTVTVTDDDAPVIAGCPSSVSVNADSNQCGTNVSWANPTATDNCAVTSFTGSHTSGSFFGTGTTTVGYLAVDPAGLTDTCTFTITVTDNTSPIFAGCPNDTTIIADSANCTPTVNWNIPTVSDNCGIASQSNSHNPGTVFPQGVTNVYYVATDSSGNTDSCSFNVTINSTPLTIVSITPNVYPSGYNVTCNGLNDGVATISMAGGCLPYSFIWSNGDTTATTSNLAAGLYTVIITDGNGNSTSGGVTITEPPVIDSLITVVVDSPACIGDTAQLIGTSGYVSYGWSTGVTTQNTEVTTSGTYTLTVVDSFGCSGSESVNVNYLPFNDPNPIITPGNPIKICQGDSVQLDGGASYVSYEWYRNDTLVSTGSQYYWVTTAGNYTVRVENGFGCKAESDPAIVTVTNPVTPTVIVNGDTLTSSVSGISYQWYLNGSAISGATNISYIATMNGFYQVSVTDSNGCTVISDSTDILIGVDGGLIGGGISVYPSPFDRDINVEFTLSKAEEIEIRVVSVLGVEVYRYRTDGKQTTIKRKISLLGMSSGVYMVEVEAGGRTLVRKVVKQ